MVHSRESFVSQCIYEIANPTYFSFLPICWWRPPLTRGVTILVSRPPTRAHLLKYTAIYILLINKIILYAIFIFFNSYINFFFFPLLPMQLYILCLKPKILSPFAHAPFAYWPHFQFGYKSIQYLWLVFDHVDVLTSIHV